MGTVGSVPIALSAVATVGTLVLEQGMSAILKGWKKCKSTVLCERNILYITVDINYGKR